MSTDKMSELALQEWPWKDLAAKDAEIERLTAELAVAVKERSNARHQLYEANDECDRLLAALEEIATRFKDSTDLSLQVATDIAEGALAGPPRQRP